jgi:drug/metabolite transporter (DMT)-like permease
LKSDHYEKSLLKGIISFLVSLLFLALVAVCIKLAGKSDDAKLGWILFIQYSTVLIIAASISIKQKFANMHSAKPHLEIMRGVFGVVSFILFVISMKEIPMVNATLLQNTAPLFIPIVSFIWFREITEKKVFLGIAIGFVGILLIIKPETSAFNIGAIIGLISGILLAISYVVMSIITKYDGFNTILIYYAICAFGISLPFGIINWSNPPLNSWIYASASGIFLMGYLHMQQYSYKHVEASKLSPFNYFLLIYIGVLDWLLFGHIPDFLTIAGIAIVSTGGIISIIHHERKNPATRHSWH